MGRPFIVVGAAHVGAPRGVASGPWRQLQHDAAAINLHGATARTNEHLTTICHSFCGHRMAEVRTPFYGGAGGWAPGEDLPAHRYTTMSGLYFCEHCSVFAVRDADAALSIGNIALSWLRGRGRPTTYTRQNRGDNPRPFYLPGRMRGAPRWLQPVVDVLIPEAQALLLYALDSGALDPPFGALLAAALGAV
jgi:hypothetical protein